MRFLPLVLVALVGLIPGARAQKGPAAPPGPADALRRLCAAWPEGPAPLLEAPFRAPPLRYEGGGLELDLEQPALVEDGPQGLIEPLPAAASEAQAPASLSEGARLVRAQAAGQLQARLAFYPERGRLLSTPCLSLGGGRVLRLRVQPLWVSLWQDGKEQARLYTERGDGLAPEGKPDVQIDLKAMVFEGDEADLRGPMPSLRGPATACYGQALARRPDLAGRVILGADIDRDGRPSGARVEVDTIGDATLSRCLREALAAARLGRQRRGGHLSLPVSLRRLVGPGVAGK